MELEGNFMQGGPLLSDRGGEPQSNMAVPPRGRRLWRSYILSNIVVIGECMG
jgi:hypothetical protein